MTSVAAKEQLVSALSDSSKAKLQRSCLPSEKDEGSCSKTEVSGYIPVESDSLSSEKIENTYKIDPDRNFQTQRVERTVRGILAERLKNRIYDPVCCKVLSQNLAAEIMENLKTLNIQRFKLVTVVSIGSMKEKPGIQFGSRCLWNQSTDSFASVKYINGSLFAVAMVYALYFE
ncbi:hypothetical protein LSH36_357g01014 [Paralvinella palmiformis]|uniref:Uncharacterized protein n=1 Tax=Paralvinella palmiformis TaxID=53620 RepID=A0AAD9JEC0_9ANNE|nr:hypothetical protein LSH36_357g01014 [Paralvinella palmiformis]